MILVAQTKNFKTQFTSTHFNSLQLTSTHFNSLQLTSTHFNSLQLTSTHFNSLQLTILWTIKERIGFTFLKLLSWNFDIANLDGFDNQKLKR